MIDITKLWDWLAAHPGVEAVALVGSRATGKVDEKSDYDVYVYLCSREKICKISITV